MELPHWEFCGVAWRRSRVVLILILMELPHWVVPPRPLGQTGSGLNPYSNGITSLGPEHGLNKPGRGNRVLILILMELPHWVFKRTLLKP